MRRPVRRVTLVLLVLLTGVALVVGLKPVSPARTADDFAHKAKDTAQSVLSSVQTARLAARVGTRDDAFGPYVSVMLSESDVAVAKAQGVFDSVQPPDAALGCCAASSRSFARPFFGWGCPAPHLCAEGRAGSAHGAGAAVAAGRGLGCRRSSTIRGPREEDLRCDARDPHGDGRIRRHRRPRRELRDRRPLRHVPRVGRACSASSASSCTPRWQDESPPSPNVRSSTSSASDSALAPGS